MVLEQLRQHAGHQRREAAPEMRDERGEHGAHGAHRGGAEVAELCREGRAELRQQLVEQVGGGEVGNEGGQRVDGRDTLLPIELCRGYVGVGAGEGGGGEARAWEGELEFGLG